MSENRTKKAVKNIGFNYANQILTIILSFISRTVFIWGLGIEYLGINGLFGDVLGLLSMADLGFGTAMVYSFYKPLAEKDYKKMAGLTTFYKKIYEIIAILVLILGLSVVPFLSQIIKLDRKIPHLVLYYILSLANVVFSYLCVYRTSVLTADQKGYKVTRITMVINSARSFLQIIGIIIWKNYILYLILGCLSVLINNLIASRLATKEYPFIEEKVELATEEKKEIFSNIGSVFLYKLSSVLLNTTDNLIISTVIGTVMVGYYSNYLMLQNKISMFYTLLFTSLTASIGNLIASEKEEKRYAVFESAQSISFIVCGIIIPCYVLLVNDLIKVWLGAEYVLPNLVVVAIGGNMYLSCVLQPLWSYREATGLYNKTKWIMVLCAILNLILSVILGKKIGLAGVLFASGLSRLLTYVWYEPQLLFKEYFGNNVWRYYIQLLSNALLIVIVIVISRKLSAYMIVDSVLKWIIKAFIIGILTLLISLLVYSKSEGLKLVKIKIRGFVSNRRN